RGNIRHRRAPCGAIALTLGPSPGGRGRWFLLPLGEGDRRPDEGRIHMATRTHPRLRRVSRPGDISATDDFSRLHETNRVSEMRI
ncbi:hypothetical protein KAH81_02950, partial [bacterium]|nr:hypothetical protein [bacterium]